MDNLSKKIWVIVLLVVVGFLMTGLTSCKDKVEGGTIVVKIGARDAIICITDAGMRRVSDNVHIYSYTSGYLLQPTSHEFVVTDDGSYWVCFVTTVGNAKPEKKVSVSGGETVTVDLTN
jgi:hypothetical protein